MQKLLSHSPTMGKIFCNSSKNSEHLPIKSDMAQNGKHLEKVNDMKDHGN